MYGSKTTSFPSEERAQAPVIGPCPETQDAGRCCPCIMYRPSPTCA
jgi:hypothetical protein